MKRALQVLAGFAMFIAGSAFAQTTIYYTFTGNGSGNVNGVAFANQNFTIQLAGLSSTVSSATDPSFNALTSGSVTIAGTACATGCPIAGVNVAVVYAQKAGAAVHGISLAGSINVAGSTFIEGCFNCGGPALLNDSLNASEPVTPAAAFGAFAPYPAFNTSAGPVNFTALNALAFGVSAAVPTLSEWVLMILAGLLGVVGFWHMGRRAPNIAA